MTEGNDKGTEVPLPPTMTAEEASRKLGVDEKELAKLRLQGRLDVFFESGDQGVCYDAASVLRMRAEDLIREMTAKARENSSDLADQVDELAALQHQRGRLAEQREMLPRLEEMGAEIRWQTEQIQNLK